MLKKKQFYTFGEFHLDAQAKVLLRKDEPVKLGRKAVETLLVLVEHPGQVLTKEDLIESVWEGRVVDEANLQQNIAVIRKTLGAKVGEPGFIQTFPGRGYRIIGPVGTEEEHEPEAAPPPKPKRRWIRFAAAGLVALAIVGGWIARRALQTPVGSLRRTPVARLDGKELQAAISADGKDVAFILDGKDRRPAQLWLRTADKPQAVLLSTGDWDYSSPAWSPDGKLLAYMKLSRDKGELAVASPSGSGERVVTSVYANRHGLFYRHIGWSPDGKTLAIDDASDSATPFGIFLISVATGERHRITSPPPHYVGDVEPKFSPDGRTLTFIRIIHRTAQSLLIVAPDGSGVRQLNKEGTQVTGYDWTGDGKSLIYASNQSGEFRLWRVHPQKGSPPATPDPSDVYADAPIQLAVARAAPVLVYSVLRQDFNIWRLNLREGAVDRWTEVINSSAQDASPQYSPDGREICFRSDRSGEEQIWVSDASGANPRPATQGQRNPSVGRWSPDGRSIVFNDSKVKDIYIATRNASNRWTQRALGVKGVHPVFSKDGRWIYSGRNVPDVESVFRIPAAGGTAETIAPGHGMSFGLSADGKVLYFVRDLTDTTLWQLELGSGRVSQALDGLLPYCTSCWDSTPRGIYYMGSDSHSAVGQAIFFHSFKGGPDRKVVEYPEPLFPLGSGPFSLSPDGKDMLTVRVDASRADAIRAEPFR